MSFKEEERRHQPLSVIERLRMQYPNENILDVAVELDNPLDMKDFFFQYANELETNHSLKVVRQRPFDTAKGHIIRSANYAGREVVRRWHEFFATGTLQEIVDHSFDWTNPHDGGEILKSSDEHSYQDWIAEHHRLLRVAEDKLAIQDFQVRARSAASDYPIRLHNRRVF